MGRPRFFVPHLRIQHSRTVLTGAEFHHLRHVLRLRRGDQLTICDITGREHSGVVAALSSTTAEVTITASSLPAPPPFSLTLAPGLLKGQKMDWVIEKTTELGVSRVIPFSSTLTVALPPQERQSERVARWQRIAQNATKQSGNPAPTIVAPQSFRELLRAAPEDAGKVLLYERESALTLKSFAQTHPTFSSLWIVVGPEGGFTAEEVADAREAGFPIVGLGTRILRAETAGIVAVALCQFLWGEQLPPLPFPPELP